MPPTEESKPQDNLYEGGKGDGRQTTRAHLEASGVLFRPRYRRLNEAESDLHDRIKTQAAVLAALFYEVEPIHAGPSRNRERGANVQLAIRNLEDAVYRAVKGLTGPTAESDAAAKMEQHEKIGRLATELDKARSAKPELFGAAGVTSIAADVADAERKAGIADLPADQQKQLDERQSIAPRPDPGTGAGNTQSPDPSSREVDDPARLPEGDKSMRDQTLIGSDAFDALVDIGGAPVQLGELVVGAQQRAGISVRDLVEVGQAIRDALIENEITILRQQAAGARATTPDGEKTREARRDDDPHVALQLQGNTVAGIGAAPARPVEHDGRGSTGDAATVTSGPATGQTA